MLNDIKVGPAAITINQGSNFMVTTEAGEIAPDAELGFFARDTRLVSSYRFFIQDKPWLLATSAALSYYGARYWPVRLSGTENRHKVDCCSAAAVMCN